MLSKNDYKTLIVMYQYECINEFKSLTVAKIREFTSLSVSKIRKTLYVFKSMGYVSEGILSHNSKTYYVTDLGIKKVNELVGGRE